MGNFLKHIHPLLRRKKSKDDYEDVNYAILQSLKDELEETESETIKSKIQSTLDKSTDEYLDTFGDWFGVYRREDEDDEHYRQRIIDYVLLKRGTNNAIIEALRNYLEDYESKISIYEPYTNIFYTNKSLLNGEDRLMGFYYRFAIIDITIGRPFPETIMEIINSFKPAGVTFYLTYDGSYQMSGDGVVKLPSTDFDIDWYTTTDVFDGYGLISYGHLNLGNKKKSNAIIYDEDKGEFVDVFRTNHSLINSKAVLSGDPSVGKLYYNTAYVTTSYYKPTKDDYSNSIEKYLGREVETLDYDFYSKTDIKDANPARYKVKGTNSVENLYMTLDVLNFYQNHYQQDIKGKSHKEVIEYIKDKSKKPKLTYTIKGLVEPNENIRMDLSLFNFRTSSWETVSYKNITINWLDELIDLGNLYDFISDTGIIFIGLSIIANKSFMLELDYLDITFEYRKDNVYTIRPYLGDVTGEQTTIFSDLVKYFKLASLDRADIVTKPGYRPMQYLRLTDGYDNSINRNLISGTLMEDKSLLEGLINKGYSPEINIENEDETITKKSISIQAKEEMERLGVTIKGNIFLTEGNEYTITFKYKTKEKINFNYMYFMNSSLGNFNMSSYFKEEPVVNNNKWNEIIKTITFSGKTGSYGVLIGSMVELGEKDKLYLSDIKIEEGKESTTYQPNPEDLYGANDPNKSVEIVGKNLEGNTIDSKNIENKKYKIGDNLIKNSESRRPTRGSSNSKRVVYDLYKPIEEGKEYTLTFKIDVEEGNIKNKTSVMLSDDISDRFYLILDSNNKGEYTFIADKNSKELSIFMGSGYTEENENSNGTIIQAKLEEGSKATPYTIAPEDQVNFLDKTIKFDGTHNNIQAIGIKSSIETPKAILSYSIFGEQFTKIKTIENLQKGETYTDNEYTDLYGVKQVSYENFNIMSNVSLGKIYNELLGELTTIQGDFLDMPDDFFNTTWTTTDIKDTLSLNTLRVVRDSINGYIDNSTGIITRLNILRSIKEDTITIMEDKIDATIEEPITMGTSISFEDVQDKPITTKSIKIDKSIKVINE